MPSDDSSAWIELPTGECREIVGACEFGRGEYCQVRIDTPKASRRHSLVHAQRRGERAEYWFIDLGSANGSFVNERRVVRPMRLRDGDRIRIADHEFVFHVEARTEDRAQTAASLATMPESRSGHSWMLVADIADSTPLLQQMPAAQYGSKLGRWLRTCEEIIEAGGGTINQYLGDGFLAYWPGDASLAATVVATVQKLHGEQANTELPFRIVVHCGEVTVTTEPAQGIEVLISPDVHYIFRAEKVAGSMQQSLLFTTAAQVAIGEGLPLQRLPGEYELKGFPGLHAFYVPAPRP